MKRLKCGYLALLAALLVVPALLAACGSYGGSDDLSGTHWSLVSLNGEDALAESEVTMHLGGEDRLTGTSGCNTYTGTWEAGEDDALTLDPGAMTLMACPEPIMQQEQSFLSALADSASFSRDDDELTLRNANADELAVLTRLANADLTGTNWQALYVNNGEQAVAGVLPDATITAVFSDDDTLAGNAGCNQYNAGFTTDGDAITIEQPGSTLMACEQPIMDQEAAYLAALTNAATYELGVRMLYLRDSEGALLVAFRMAEE